MLETIFYLGSILLANILVNKFGIVTVFGITFPAGAIAIGLTFSARDLIQRKYGKWKCWIWMIVASIITMTFNLTLAYASLIAFIVSEFVDWFIYTVSKRPIYQRILLSNLFGTPIDSILFVTLAFGFYWNAMFGQTLIKLISSFFIIPFIKNRYK